MQTKLNNLVRAAMVAALIFALTWFPRVAIPTPTGATHLFHLGLPFSMLIVFILPWKYAVFAAAFGSALVNVLGLPNPMWAPATFVLRAMVVLIVYKLKGFNKFLAFLIAGVLSATGYYLYEVAVFSQNFIASAPGYGMLLIEGVGAAIVAWVVMFTLDKRGEVSE